MSVEAAGKEESAGKRETEDSEGKEEEEKKTWRVTDGRLSTDGPKLTRRRAEKRESVPFFSFSFLSLDYGQEKKLPVI